MVAHSPKGFLLGLARRARKVPQQEVGRRSMFLRPTAAKIPVTSDTALTYSAVYAAVGILSSGIGRLPMKVVRKLDNGGREVAEDHPIHKMLTRHPTASHTPVVWKEKIGTDLCLYGNWYAEITEDALWPIPPNIITLKRDFKSGKLFYDVQAPRSNVTVQLLPHKVLHIPMLGDGLEGLSPIQLARQTIGAGLAMEEHAGALFGNGAIPGGVLEVAGKLDQQQADDFRKNWQGVHGGSQNAGKTAILTAGMTYKPLTMPSDDAQFLESRIFQVQEIARWFRVPPHMLAEMSNATFSNIEEQQRNFLDGSLMHVLLRIEQELTRKLLGHDDSLSVKFTTQAFERGDAKTRAEVRKIDLDAGFLSINDALEMEDRNKIGEEGDLRLAQINRQALERFLDDPEPPALPTAVDPSAVPVPQGDPADDTEDDTTRDILKPFAVDAAGRLLHKELASLKRLESKGGDVDAAVRDFYVRFEDDVRRTIKPMADAMGWDAGRRASQIVETSRSAVLSTVRGGKPLASLLSGWKDCRANELVLQLLAERN